MIAKEFMAALQETSDAFEWKLYRRQQQLRGSLRNQAVKQLFDPITAVCYAKTGTLFREDQWTEAAAEIGLTWMDAGDLSAAANGVLGGSSDEVHYRQQLRHSMIEALSLDQSATSVSPIHLLQNFFEQALGRGPVHTA